MSIQTIAGISTKDVFLPEVDPDDQMETIERAIILTVAYADVFDFPMTRREIHRYLINVQASLETVNQALDAGQHTARLLTFQQGFFTLRGRESIVETRQRRTDIANILWPKARFYGKLIALLPFTRMVAVTGALAVGNTDREADIDFMIVTQPGRLWLCRAMVILLVRLAALRSDTICPNLLVSEKAMIYDRRDLYTAHEMVQMNPLAGHKIYQSMMSLNTWTLDYLPNTGGDNQMQIEPVTHSLVRKVRNSAEKFLLMPWIDRFEHWEMTRKIRKFRHQNESSKEANFSADWCRGYFNAHEQRTLSAFAERVSVIEAAWRI